MILLGNSPILVPHPWGWLERLLLTWPCLPLPTSRHIFPQSKMSLKCLAAQSIRHYNLDYQGQVTVLLLSCSPFFSPALLFSCSPALIHSLTSKLLLSCTPKPALLFSWFPAILDSYTPAFLFSCSPGLLHSCTPILLLSSSPALIHSLTPKLLLFCSPALLLSCSPALLLSCSSALLPPDLLPLDIVLSCSAILLLCCSPTLLIFLSSGTQSSWELHSHSWTLNYPTPSNNCQPQASYKICIHKFSEMKYIDSLKRCVFGKSFIYQNGFF